jgi:chromate transporter
MFLAFARIGLFSFGGGPSTLVLMQQEVMRRRAWLNAREFGFTFALSRMYPGAHLLAQAVLIGHLLRGLRGAAICLLGLILPACLVTLLFTLVFVGVRANLVGAAIIDGILPATAGLTVAVSLGIGRDILRLDRGWAKVVTAALMAGSFLLMGPLGVQSVFCVLLAGLAGALLYRGAAAATIHDDPPDPAPR